jgi:hypothetical protein
METAASTETTTAVAIASNSVKPRDFLLRLTVISP